MFFHSIFLLFVAQIQPSAPSVLNPGKIKADKAVSIRSFYDKRSPEVGKVEPGTPVRVVAERPPWARIEIPGGLMVWVYGDFVDVEGNQGLLNATHVRARPLPSTGAHSYPIGQFKKGDKVLVIEERDSWLKVLAPESLAAWVPLTSVQKLSFTAVDSAQSIWEKSWNDQADLRRARWILLEEDAENITLVDVAAVAEDVVGGEEAISSLIQLDDFDNEILNWSPAESEICSAVEDYLLEAERRTKEHANQVVKDIDAYQHSLAKDLERVYSIILLHADVQDYLERSRQGLDKLDALVRFRNAALEARGQRATVRGDLELASQSLGKSISLLPSKEVNMQSVTIVGWMEYRPHLYSRVPFALTRGDMVVPVRSYDGRFSLKEFVGRELVIQGVFRQDSDITESPIFAVTHLRVLPRRFSR